MKAIACYALHYGCEYLAWSIRSLQHAVDEIHVFYTAKPSYGFATSLVCPDSEAQLEAETHRFAQVPIIWHRGVWHNEGAHKGEFAAVGHKVGADMVVCCDADELWPTVDGCLKLAYDANRAGRWMADFTNFWRAFGWEIRDHFTPIRLLDLRHPLHVDAHLGPLQPGPVYHFGYAQSERTMRYKMSCHGHLAEFRPHWLEEKFLPWTPEKVGELTDLHPCVFNLWDRAHPVSEVVTDHVNDILGDHPYRGLEVIR
jgi:hypothetical protein